MAWLNIQPFVSASLLGVYSANLEIVKKAYRGLNLPPYKIEGEPVSAVIPTHNEEGFIDKCLTCLLNQTYFPIEIIVVDFESGDKTREIARLYGATVIRSDTPGVGNARDLGASASSSNFHFHTDADSVFENRLIEEMARDLERGCDVVSVPAVFGGGDPICILAWQLARFRIPWWVSGRATLVPKMVWENVGGWELPWGEERHFGRKLKEAGYRINKNRSLSVSTSRLPKESRANRLRSTIEGIREPLRTKYT